jgi:hypothetical protein
LMGDRELEKEVKEFIERYKDKKQAEIENPYEVLKQTRSLYQRALGPAFRQHGTGGAGDH